MQLGGKLNPFCYYPPFVGLTEAGTVVGSRAESEWHRKTAARLFNRTWDLILKKGRTKEDVVAMIHMAHASRYHWSVVGGPKEAAIGEWQISRVYAVLGRPEPSLFHAQRALEICEARHVDGFPLAYAYEALARAFAIAGKARLREACMKLAKAAGEKIPEAEDRTQFFKDLRTVPRARRR
ncbi:MAG TPA: hypothetical protein VFA17_09125 [Thermoplasmata archaeon]|nr:hypothetical protein [Thermoplasmata archaeon]